MWDWPYAFNKLIKKSRIRETKNLSTDTDSRTDIITFFPQEIAGDGRVLIEETEFWWQSGTHFFSSGDCRWWTSYSRRPTGFALDSFFIRKLQMMDMFFKETDWLFSPGISFAPLGESHGGGDKHTNRQTLWLLERIGLRADSLKRKFSWLFIWNCIPNFRQLSYLLNLVQKNETVRLYWKWFRNVRLLNLFLSGPN